MELTPADLGDSYAIALFQMRAAQLNASQRPSRRIKTALASALRPNLLTRFWARQTGLSGEVAEEAARSVSGQLNGIVFGLGGGMGLNGAIQATVMSTVGHGRDWPIALMMGAISVTGFLMAGLIPGHLIRKWGRTPLNGQELERLLSQEDDELERSYLLLIRDALSQKQLAESAQRELKEAIIAIGEALDRLPPAPVETASRDTGSLKAEATQLRQSALQETDRVAAGSLERRADALERSANALEKSVTLLRRNALLRMELAAQLEALRLELASQSVHGTQTIHGTDTSSLAAVADIARGVAREADALVRARAELDAPPPQIQQVGGH